jgi:hypothetical protein
VLRDPISIRQELLRRGMAPFEMVLEQAIDALGTNESERTPIVQARGGRAGFHPDVIANLVAMHRLNEAGARTLGGQPLTVAMIEAADPGFSFDAGARRVTRRRLARVLLALARLTDPTIERAARKHSCLLRMAQTLVQLDAPRARSHGRVGPFVFAR